MFKDTVSVGAPDAELAQRVRRRLHRKYAKIGYMKGLHVECVGAQGRSKSCDVERAMLRWKANE